MKTTAKIVVAVLATLGVLMGGALALSWEPDRPVSALATRWAPAPSVFVDVDGMKVHLRDEGPRNDPNPIVLLHGTSASLHTWDGWVDALKGQRRVIRFDLPGFGLTGPFPDNDYTMAHYVHLTTGILDQLGVQRAVLGGNSFGGNVAWETAKAAPARVSQLILVDASGYKFTAASMPIGFRIAQTPVLNKLMEVTLPRNVVEASVRNVYGDPSKVTPALVDRYFDLTLTAGNRHALAERFKQAPTGQHEDQIATLKQPTLILWGRRDHLIPLENAEKFHRDIAGSQLVVFDDLGHVPHEEDPARTVGAAKPFLGVN